MSSERVSLRYAVHIHPEDGGLWAEVEELPGCFASGDNEEELQEALMEAIGLYLSTDHSHVQVQRCESGPVVGQPHDTSTVGYQSGMDPIETVQEQRFLVSS